MLSTECNHFLITVSNMCYDAYKKLQSTDIQIKKIYAVLASCVVCMTEGRGRVWSWSLTDESEDIESSFAVTVLLHSSCCLLLLVAPNGRLEDGGLFWLSIALSFLETAEGINSTAKCFAPIGTGDSWHGNDSEVSKQRRDCLLESRGELNCVVKEE